MAVIELPRVKVRKYRSVAQALSSFGAVAPESEHVPEGPLPTKRNSQTR